MTEVMSALKAKAVRPGLSNDELARAPLSGELLSFRHPDEGNGDG